MNPTLLVFGSPPKNNPFAPEFSAPMWHSSINNPELVAQLRQLVLSKEAQLIAAYPDTTNDGGTGLGSNSLTAKFSKFNLFTWTEPCAKELQNWIKEQYLAFLQTVNVPSTETYINCWANVMRKGEAITPHWHGSSPNTYLSMHFSVKTANTSTEYRNPYNQDQWLSMPNEDGVLTIFPSYLVHRTTTHMEDFERVTIAMDILTAEGVKEMGDDDIPKNAVRFF
jgi:hypothetical protein